MEKEVSQLFASLAREETFRALAPALHVGAPPEPVSLSLDDGAVAGARRSLDELGYFSLERLLPSARATALASAVRALDEAGLSTCFAYAYDEAWSVGLEIARALTPLLGERYALLADVWAWRIPPQAGRRGWVAHRGTYEDERRAHRAPRTINVWLSLSDVTVDTACMHVVPFARDPHYPDALARVDFDPGAAVPLPALPGTLLGWSSNVLHFGGPMTPRATEHRVSLSYTLRAPPCEGAVPEPPSFEGRIDLIADMIATYGEHEGPSLEATRRWAELHRAMRALGRTRGR